MKINQYDYKCPKCKERLNEDKHVVFSIKRDNNGIMLYLDPKPGVYKFVCKPETVFKSDEIIEFHCPHCDKNLKSEKYNKFVEIELAVTKKVSMPVFFSRVHGVHKTYVGIEDFEDEYGHEMSKS